MGTLLEIREIQASYKEYPALKGVSLAIKENTVMGLVGESGSGKSTLAKVITGLLKKDAGEILFEGKPYGNDSRGRNRAQCQKIQMVFQNPEGSLNPKHTIGKILSDAMLFHKITDRTHVKEKCEDRKNGTSKRYTLSLSSFLFRRTKAANRTGKSTLHFAKVINCR